MNDEKKMKMIKEKRFMWDCLRCGESHYSLYDDHYCSSCKAQAKLMPEDSIERLVILGVDKNE